MILDIALVDPILRGKIFKIRSNAGFLQHFAYLWRIYSYNTKGLRRIVAVFSSASAGASVASLQI